MSEKRRENFSILFKPTHACNFKCEYCHDRSNRERVGDMRAPDELLKHTLKLLEEYTKNVQFIWHGGEPTVLGTQYYRDVQDEFYYRYKTKFEQSLQSNGSLLNEDWLKLKKEANISIGVSNDILSQEIRVGMQYSLGELAKLFDKHEFGLSVITVINGENCEMMLDILKKGEEIGLRSLSMNAIYNPSRNKKLPKHLELDPVKYAESFEEMMKYWLYNDIKIGERSMKEKICLVCGSTEQTTCTYGDCRMHWIGVGPTGEVTFCDRDLGEGFDFGNIMDMESIDDYHNSQGFIKFYNDVQSRLDNYCSKCNYFRFCRGGCNANHLSATGTLTKCDEIRCECTKKTFDVAYKLLRELDIRSNDMNKTAKEYLNNLDYIPLVEIKEFLKKKNIDLSNATYEEDNITNCKEFKLFKLFNQDKEPAVGSIHSDYVGYHPEPTENMMIAEANRKSFIESFYRDFKNKIYEITEGK